MYGSWRALFPDLLWDTVKMHPLGSGAVPTVFDTKKFALDLSLSFCKIPRLE